MKIINNQTPKNLELSELAKYLKPGIYKHYKGEEYQVMGVAMHSENPAEELVVYKHLLGDILWVRPLAMFCEDVSIGEYSGQRFTFIRNK